MIIIFFISQALMKFEICDIMISINTERGFYGVQNRFWIFFLHCISQDLVNFLGNTLNQTFLTCEHTIFSLYLIMLHSTKGVPRQLKMIYINC